MDIPSNLKTISEILKNYEFHNLALLQEASKAYQQPQELGIAKAIASMEKYATDLVPARSIFSEMAKYSESPAFKLANSANLSILRSIENAQPVGKAFTELARVSTQWEKYARSLATSVDMGFLSQTALNLHIAKNSQLSLLAQNLVSKVSWSDLGGIHKLQTEQQTKLYDSFIGISKSYSSFASSFEKLPSRVFSYPPFITRLPSVEFYNSAQLLEVLSLEKRDNTLIQEERNASEEILSETEVTLPGLLRDLSPNLIPLWRGAIATLNSDNPDKTRHFATSLRELFTHVLHILSPDSEIRKWFNSPELFKDNDPKKPPTRKGRLLFICRNINNGPFSDFIDKDIDAFLCFMDLFQRGTHEIPAPYTMNQLQILKVRAESAIRYMIEVSRSCKS